MTEKPRRCAYCKRPATRRLTIDLDIEGIPICDCEECKLQAAHAIYVAMEEGRREAMERVKKEEG